MAPRLAAIMDPMSAQTARASVRQSRMYQLIRQKGPIKDVTFEIEFIDPGAEDLSRAANDSPAVRINKHEPNTSPVFCS
jgi:hypothetical protein